MIKADEILNIDYHRRRLLVKALKKYSFRQAAKHLQVSTRTVHRWRKDYNITGHEIAGQNNNS